MSNTEQKKQAVARAAIEYVEYDDIIGVGTGSTVDYFIEYLKPLKNKISGTGLLIPFSDDITTITNHDKLKIPQIIFITLFR